MKSILLLLLFSVATFAQTTGNFSLMPKVKIGTAFSGISAYQFTVGTLGNSDPHTIYPSYSIGIGLETSDIVNYYNAGLSLSVESSYGQATTGEVEHGNGKAKFTLTSLPILLWTKISTNGKIVPFVRLGVGTERNEVIEKYTFISGYDFDLYKWFFCWGLGAGIELNIDSYNVSLFVDSIIKENGLEYHNREREINFNFRNTVLFSGIQFGYRF